ncbi:hypothetical protein [Flavobacterium sp. 3HN19-14]|uniref:hypothetical protein n=1 Tax=Flavobacterium sp. 3HN19-14 TaxID=3448133 RepID=UPI003EE1610A
MVNKNFEIKYSNHFKLYVLLKDQIIFESELRKNEIPFYKDADDQINAVSTERYFLSDDDRLKIDKIISENEIIASTETILMNDYRDGRKVNKLYFIVAGIVFIIMFLIIFIDSI